MKPTLVRTAVSGGALALTLGVAAPALACVTSDAPGAKSAMFTGVSDPGKHAKDDQTLTLAELKAKVDSWLGTKIDRLGKVRDRVEASTRLADDQRADALALIDARIATLQTARDAVAAATTRAEVKAALKTAFTPTVDEVKARVDAKLGRWIHLITAKLAAVEAGSSMDPQRQAAKVAKLQAWLDTLTQLRADVAADTTIAEVKADLEAAGITHLFGSHRHHGWGWFGEAKGKHRDHDGKGWSDRGRSDQADPSSWHRSSGSTRTMSVSWHGGSRADSHRGDSHQGSHHGGDRGHGGYGHR